MKIKYFYILFSALFIVSCSKQTNLDKPTEIIEFLTLEAGHSDSILVDDIFFAEQYNLQLGDNPNLDVCYDEKNNKLIISPKADFSGLTFLRFENNNRSAVIPVKVKKKTPVTFSCSPGYKAKNIFIMGNFNNWNRSGDRMTDDDGDGVFKVTIPLDDGVYEYQFVIDQREIYDPQNPEKVDNGFGYFNSLKRVLSAEKQNAPRLYFLPQQKNKTIEIAVEFNFPLSEIKIHGLLDNKLAPAKLFVLDEGRLSIDLSGLSALNKIQTLSVVATHHDQPGNVLTLWLKNGNLLLPQDRTLWNDAIVYSMMVDRFNNGNPENDNPVEHPELARQANFNGGDLAGIIQKLNEGYFDSLGINTFWISPVNKTTNSAFREWPEPHRWFSGYHGYWPVSSTEVEPRFGSMKDFKQLVETAHKHGIKVLLDFISNHTHKEHQFFSEHRDWYGQVDLPNGGKNIRRWDEYRLTTWFDTFIPSFDFLGSDEAMEAMTDNAVWWIEETGIDGFRHDATKHVPYEFWRMLTRKIKSRINPQRKIDIYQIGETFGGHELIKSYVTNGMLDAQFSFNQFFTARRVFTEEGDNFKDLTSAIEKALEVYGYSHRMGNIMDSHDQVRMMALLEGDLTLSDNGAERAWDDPPVQVDEALTYQKEITFLTYLFTVPGIPIIYYGDEIGMTGAADPDNRRMMRFGDELSAVENDQSYRVRKLINLRNNHSALRRGDYKTLHAEGDLLIYTRGDSYERLLIAVNKGREQQEVTLQLPEWMRFNKTELFFGSANLKNERLIVSVTIPAWSVGVWKLLSAL